MAKEKMPFYNKCEIEHDCFGGYISEIPQCNQCRKTLGEQLTQECQCRVEFLPSPKELRFIKLQPGDPPRLQKVIIKNGFYISGPWLPASKFHRTEK